MLSVKFDSFWSSGFKGEGQNFKVYRRPTLSNNKSPLGQIPMKDIMSLVHTTKVWYKYMQVQWSMKKNLQLNVDGCQKITNETFGQANQGHDQQKSTA